MACAERTQISFTAFTPVQVLNTMGKAATKPTNRTVDLLPSPNQSRTAGVGDAGDRRADADQRQEDVLGPARAPIAMPIATPAAAASAKPAVSRRRVSKTWCGRMPAAVRRTNAAATSSKRRKQLAGKDAEISGDLPHERDTRNGNALRAITCHRLSLCAEALPAARTPGDAVGASSDMSPQENACRPPFRWSVVIATGWSACADS